MGYRSGVRLFSGVFSAVILLSQSFAAIRMRPSFFDAPIELRSWVRAGLITRLFGLITLLYLGLSSAAFAAPVNVALNQPVSASSVYAESCAAPKANDGSDNATDSCGGWSPTGADAQSWWQVDLGSPKQISALELVTRQNCCDDPETRQNLEIRASNDPSFASSVVLAAQGNTPLPFQATWTQSVTDTNAYRYIRATKPGYFFIAELRVWSEPPTPPPPSGNLALNRPVSASSVYADSCAAAKANDGSNNATENCGGWSPDGTDAESWWQVDLGLAYAITTLELVTRQNCCDDPETRQNFEVRASNDPSFASSVVLGAQGSTPLPFQATWTQSVSDATGYRYIRATKPGYFFIAELRVFGGAQSNQSPSITLTSPADNASFSAPANIALSASATDADGSVTKVEFYNGATPVGSDVDGNDGWAITWNVVPQGNYTLSAKAIDNSGATTISNVNNITVTSANGVDVAIASPVDNAVIADDTVLVKGTFSGPSNTGITVNGVIASTSGTTFAVEVPLQLGGNILTVTATAPDGAKITKTMTVTSSGVAPINTTASPATGIAPLTVSFSTINPAGKTIQRIDVDFDNNGTIDATSSDPSAAITHIFDSPGIYPVKVTVTHSEGTESQTVLVSVLDSGQMDQTFRAIWDGMNSALVAKNKAQALRYLNSQAQAKYGPLFDALLPYFPAIVASYSTLQQLSISGGIGEYAVNRTIGGQNRIFLIYFVLDTDGVWRLDSM